MNNWLRNILLVTIAWASLLATAQTQTQQTQTQIQPFDTIYFYRTWEQMLNFDPPAMIVNPFVDVYSPYEVYVETGDEETNKLIEDDYIALSQGDSIWLINSKYLKREFKGDVRQHQGFVPVFFNAKMAFITSYGPVSVKDILFGHNDDGTDYNVNYYYIDFLKHRVERVTHEFLSQLLEDYHDLQMRYEGMKDYKKQYMIEEFFYKYIDRATDDFMHPNILDLMK